MIRSLTKDKKDYFCDKYLERIQYDGSLDCSIETLKKLHKGHVLNIPFETIDMSLGKKNHLEEKYLLCKLLESKRGGHCLEMNGLFQIILKKIGFNITPLLARVAYRKPSPQITDSRDHHILKVNINGEEWLCDVGFAHGIIVLPISLEVNKTRQQGCNKFKIISTIEGEYSLKYHKREEGEWIDLYSFTLENCYQYYEKLIHYADTCSEAESWWLTRIICSKPTQKGRIILENRLLTETCGEKIETRLINNIDEYLLVLNDSLGIELDSNEYKGKLERFLF